MSGKGRSVLNPTALPSSSSSSVAVAPSPAAWQQMRALSSWWGGGGKEGKGGGGRGDKGGDGNSNNKGGGDKGGDGNERVVVVENKGGKDSNNSHSSGSDALAKFGGGDSAPRHPHVLALPILRRPFFPGLVQAVNITSPKVFEAISAIKNDYGHYYLGT